MGTSDKMLGDNLRWTRGSSNIPSQLHVMETRLSSGSVGQFGLCAGYLVLYKTQQVHIPVPMLLSVTSTTTKGPSRCTDIG